MTASIGITLVLCVHATIGSTKASICLPCSLEKNRGRRIIAMYKESETAIRKNGACEGAAAL